MFSIVKTRVRQKDYTCNEKLLNSRCLGECCYCTDRERLVNTFVELELYTEIISMLYIT